MDAPTKKYPEMKPKMQTNKAFNSPAFKMEEKQNLSDDNYDEINYLDKVFELLREKKDEPIK